MALSLSVGAALGSAALAAVATALQHRTASVAPDAQRLAGRQLLAFARATLAHPLWLISLLVDAAGFALHAAALHAGALALVQPILVTTLVFALPVNHWLRRERPSLRELAWAGALVAGLSGFLLLAHAARAGTAAPVPDRMPALAASGLALLALLTCTLLARRSGNGSAAAALLGTAAGIAFAGVAALLKVCTDLLARGVVPLLASWPVYALLAVGAVGLLLNQLAFQAGPLSAALPAIITVDPLVSIALGAAVFDERLHHTPGAVVAEVACLALLTTAGIALGRGEARPGRDRDPAVERS